MSEEKSDNTEKVTQRLPRERIEGINELADMIGVTQNGMMNMLTYLGELVLKGDIKVTIQFNATVK